MANSMTTPILDQLPAHMRTRVSLEGGLRHEESEAEPVNPVDCKMQGCCWQARWKWCASCLRKALEELEDSGE